MRLRLRLHLTVTLPVIFSLLSVTSVSAQAPSNLTLPQISGATAVGEILTASPGTWSFTPESFVYQWSRCSSQVLSSCNVITGANSTTYKLTESDGRFYLLISVTALNAGTGTTVSSAFSVRVLTQPVATSLPVISGLAINGSTLTLTLGVWSGISSGSFTYRWQRCTSTDTTTCQDIPNASENSYVIKTPDIGQYIRTAIRVIATNENLEGNAFSALTSRISSEPLSISTPLILGIIAVGEKLTVSQGNFAGFPEPTYSYQWQKCSSIEITSCLAIDGSTTKELVVGESMLGNYIRVMVTASNSLGVKGIPSALTGIVINPTLPIVQASPTITGVAADRQTLTLSTGTWSGVPTPTVASQWQVCTDAAGANCTDISGATSSTLKLTFADLGKYFSVKATATNRIGSASANSNLLGPVVAATKLERAPATFGFLQVGQQWLATPGTWSGAVAPTFGFQWQRCADEKGANCTDIAGATKKEYSIQAADKGSYIRVKNWIVDQSLPAYSEILAVKIAAKPELPKVEAAPATAKQITITCVKGKTTRKVSGTAPKCPSGFKKK